MRCKVAVLGGVGIVAVFAAFCAVLLAGAFSLAGPAWGKENSDPLAGKSAMVKDAGKARDNLDLIVIGANDCKVADDASIVLEDQDGKQTRFANGKQHIAITATDDQVQIEGVADDASSGDQTVASSKAIVCLGPVHLSGNDAGASDGQYGQYDNNDGLDAGPIIINVPNKPLPDTGGAPAGLAVAGCAMILLGASLLGAVFRGRD